MRTSGVLMLGLSTGHWVIAPTPADASLEPKGNAQQDDKEREAADREEEQLPIPQSFIAFGPGKRDSRSHVNVRVYGDRNRPDDDLDNETVQ